MVYHCALNFCTLIFIDSLLPYLFELSSHKDAVEFEMQSVTSKSISVELVSNSVPFVKGRLREHSEFWRSELQASQFVLNIITEGYRLPFVKYPQPAIADNHHSALVNAEFVVEAIEELHLSKCIQQSLRPPVVCSPLQVAFNARGKCTPVIDLRYVNQHLVMHKFKFEGLDLIPSMLNSVIGPFRLISSLAIIMWIFMRGFKHTWVFMGSW